MFGSYLFGVIAIIAVLFVSTVISKSWLLPVIAFLFSFYTVGFLAKIGYLAFAIGSWTVLAAILVGAFIMMISWSINNENASVMVMLFGVGMMIVIIVLGGVFLPQLVSIMQ